MDPQQPKDTPNQYGLPTQQGRVVQPLPGQLAPQQANPAADLIRQKLGSIYGDEPSAVEERAEAEVVSHRTKHQQFMYDLSHSGKSLAEIQTAWHNYYVELPDNEKHQVWQEFYSTHSQIKTTEAKPAEAPVPSAPTSHTKTTSLHHIDHSRPKPRKIDTRTISDIKSQLLSKVQGGGRASKRQNIRSLVFGLSMGMVVLFVFLFGFFNERFIAPFMTPSRSVSSTPLIIDPGSAAVGQESKLVIPKINVEIPVVFDEPSTEEKAIQSALERGVVHYATTPSPGELGNGAIFGHSANNILNKGKYKFAFVLLHKLEIGDTFFVEKDGKRYTYRVYEKLVVSPKAVEVLNAKDKPATFTLITCDPPGTSLNRLVVVAEQISPNPSTNVASTTTQNETSKPAELPSNSPTLWNRFWNWMTG